MRRPRMPALGGEPAQHRHRARQHRRHLHRQRLPGHLLALAHLELAAPRVHLQEVQPHQRVRVVDDLHLPGHARADRDALVQSALEDVFLWKDVKDKLHKKATRLTLEQQQKLCIARLLPLKPRVILMDEPCSALDAEGTQRIESLIDGLKEKFTIVIVTHNMGQAGRASQECIYMLMGKLIEHGKTSDIFLNPKCKETEMYIEGRYG